jgi:diguanylate cyclase (GGDEF)-like protein/PAS domain S-box-containing protein
MFESWQFSVIHIIPLIAAGISLLVAVSVWQKKEVPGSICLAYLMVALAEWTFLETIEKSVYGEASKILVSKIQYLGIVSVPVLFLIFAARYSQQDRWLNRRREIGLWLLPALTLILVFTNEWHQLHWSGFIFNFETNWLTYLHGPWFWIHTIFSYLCIFLATVLLIRSIFLIRESYRRQIWLVLVGALVPWIANIIYLFGKTPISGLDPTPIALIVTGLLITVSISGFRLIDLTPIARNKLVDTIQDALIVVDKRGFVVDVNPAVVAILKKDAKELLGKPAALVLDYWPYLAERFKNPTPSPTIPKLIRDINGGWYDSRIGSLRNQRDQVTGFLIILRDITDQRQAERDRKRMAAVIDQAHESILITDLTGNIIYANPSFSRISGFSNEDVIGDSPRLLKSGHHDPNFYLGLWETISKGNIWQGRLENRKKNGDIFYEAATIFPIKDSTGLVTNYAAVKRDITTEIESEQAIQQFSDMLAQLHEIGITLSLTETFDDMCRVAVESGVKYLGIDRMSLWFIDPGDTNRIVGSYGIDEDGQLRDERHQKELLENAPKHLEILKDKDNLFYQEKSPLRNDQFEIIGEGDLVISGIWDRRTLLGYLCVDNYLSMTPVSEQQRTILVLFSQLLGNLTTQKRSDQALQEFTSALATLHDISLELSLAESFDEMCLEAVQLGRQHFNFERIGIWFIDLTEPQFLRGSYGIDETGQIRDEREARLLITSNPIHGTLLSGSPRVYYRQNENLFDSEGVLVGKVDIAASGLWDGSAIIGYISIDNLFSGIGFTPNQLEILILFAQTIGNISTRVRNINEIQIYARQQEVLNQITHTAVEKNDLGEMLQSLANQLGTLLGADGSFLTLWDERAGKTIPGAAYGEYQINYQEIDILPEEKTLTEAVLEKGQSLVIDDVFKTSDLSPRLAKLFSTRSALVLPLIANHQKLGAALISFDTFHKFTQTEIQLGERAATQIALAILKSRLLAEAQQRAREAETLRQASAAVVATLNQQEAIARILVELNKVVPYDSASVQLIEDGDLVIVGERGFEPNSTQGMRFPLTSDTPNAIVFERKEYYIIADAPQVYATFRKSPHDHIHGWLGVPLRVHDEMIGMLALDSTQPGTFTIDHARLAQSFADQVAIALENTRLFEETQRLAIHDSLTDLYNRRHFMELARKEFRRAKRYQTPISVIMLDIDHFKQVNDTYGHAVGDEVLQAVAQTCKDNLRTTDEIGRYGGEEFVIILPETTAQNNKTADSHTLEPAQIVANRLRTTIENNPILTAHGAIPVTISIGLAELNAASNNVETLIDFADQALLVAKQTGRNRVVIWDYRS